MIRHQYERSFRGKRKDNGEWVEGFYVCLSNHACFANQLRYKHYIVRDVCLDFNLGGAEEVEVVPETVGQYTGLKDKNGRRIFEDDIVEVEYNANYGGIAKQRIGIFQVELHNGCFMKRREGDAYYLFCPTDVHTIIGNIHDNPDMKESVKK